MRSPTLKPITLVVILVFVSQPVVGGIFDIIPGISQLKSLFQWASGDSKGAKETQENFANQAPVVSQIKSAVQSATGDNKGALETQKNFANNAVEIAQGTPGLGHAIGVGKIIAGDREGGLNAIKSSSSSAGGVIGGLLGGPAGAILGQAAVDGVITLTNPEQRKFGVIDTIARIDHLTPGEVFDELAGVGLDVAASKKAKGKVKSDQPTKTADPGADPTRPGRPTSVASDDISITSTLESRLNDADRINNLISDKFGIERAEVDHMPKAKLLYHLRRMVDLPDEYRLKLDDLDFKDVNSFRGVYNCYLCTIGGLQGKMIGELAKYSEWPVDNPLRKYENKNVIERTEHGKNLVDYFRKNGLPDTIASGYVQATPAMLYEISKRVKDANRLGVDVYKFAYEFNFPGGAHIVTAKAWFDSEGKLRTLTTDFQIDPADLKQRFYDSIDGAGTSTPNRYAYKIYDPWGLKFAPRPYAHIIDIGIPYGQKAKLLTSEQLNLARSKLSHLSDQVKAKLTSFNFLNVKNIKLKPRGSWSLLAALNLYTLSHLKLDDRMEYQDVTGINKFGEVFEMFRKVGYPQTTVTFKGNKEELTQFLHMHVKPDSQADFVLAYETDRGTSGGVFLVWAKAWKKGGNNDLDLLFTDFDFDQFDRKRFPRSVDELEGSNGRMFYVMVPLNVQQISSTELEADGAKLDDDTLKRGVGCKNGKRIVGYLASWSKTPLGVQQASRFTNLIYAFAAMSSDGALILPNDELNRQRLIDAYIARATIKLRGHDLKLSVAIGGWSNSQHFSTILRDGNSRSRFISNIKILLEANQFDGVDIDWEYPGTGGATEGTIEDRDNYVRFVEGLRLALGPSKLISIAAAAGEEALRGFDTENLVKHLDWVGVMTYDFNGAWESKWGAYVGHNSPLFHAAPVGYSGKLNTDWAIKQYVCRSKQPSKILLGAPFYGRFWHKTVEGKDPENFEFFRMAERVAGKYGGEESYRLIKELWNTSSLGNSFRWDSKAKVPWAINLNTTTVLTFDNPESIQTKVNYAIDHNLGGMMVWSLGQDDDQLSLSKSLSDICRPTNDSIAYKCNPLGEEVRWWTWTKDQENAGRCGKSAPLYNGFYPVCDPDDPGFGCCSEHGYCGSGEKFCDCPKCINYVKYPEKLTSASIKPSRAKIQWHVGFSDRLKPGSPRCGFAAPPINDHYAICNPDDEFNSCCSFGSGFCGSGKEFCECSDCKDYSKIPEKDSFVKARKQENIHWHVGFDQVKPGEARCGPNAPQINGTQAICNPDDDGAHCCAPSGYCGSSKDFCDCKGCKNYRTIPERDWLIKARKPSDRRWHVGFGVIKPGEPRCGPKVPQINGQVALCDPDGGLPCCSKWGFCGKGKDSCECDGCLDARKVMG